MESGKKHMYEKIKQMTPEKREELKQYVESIREIKKKINEMLNETVNETGGPIAVDSMHLNINTEE